MQPIYLDFNASTPVAPEVAEMMRPLLEAHYGNPSSGHWASVPAKARLEEARGEVAALLGCAAEEIVFTSGGSEASNLAIKGVFFAARERGSHIITTRVEHPATLEACRFLERLGASITYVPVDRTGMVNPESVRAAITPRTILVTIMHANNEVGTIQPIAEIARIARQQGVLIHTDAAQSLGKIPVNVEELGVDLLTIVGHKFYAPKGVGALYVRSGVVLEPLIHGGGHESGRRSGTESVLMAAALGAACSLAAAQDCRAIARMRDRLWDGLKAAFGEHVVLNGHPICRLPNTLNVSFVGKVGGDILSRLPNVAASTGSACHSGRIKLSPVLAAMGVSEEVGMGAIRFSLGRSTTEAEIDAVIDGLRRAVSSLFQEPAEAGPKHASEV
jgi:cysteine desulfurase